MLLLLIPVGYFAAMYVLYPPVRRQPALTSSRVPADFDAAVLASGGPDRTRTGLAIDLGFVAVVALIVPAVFAHYGQPWWVPLIACALDLIEDALALKLLRRGPDLNGVKLLKAVSTGKLIAYGVALAVALRVVF